MSETSAMATPTALLTPCGGCPDGLIGAIRRQVSRGADWQHTADLVAEVLRHDLPAPQILPSDRLRGDPAGYQTHLLYAAPDGSFSIAAMVWLAGQTTPIHDHVAWCVTAVLQGNEDEEIFAAAGDGLRVVARNKNLTGTVCGFAPPGDIHRVRNAGPGTAVSMHVYGADLTRLGSSIRREYR